MFTLAPAISVAYMFGKIEDHLLQACRTGPLTSALLLVNEPLPKTLLRAKG